MKKKIVIRMVFGLVGLLVLSFTVLCVHLYSVAQKKKQNLVQLSRIDFQDPIDSVEALRIKNYVTSMPGVKGAYFNVPQGNFVYGYLVGTQQSKDVFEKVMDFTDHRLKAERHVVSDAQLKQGCPAGMNNSFVASLSHLLLRIFN